MKMVSLAAVKIHFDKENDCWLKAFKFTDLRYRSEKNNESYKAKHCRFDRTCYTRQF